MLQSLRSEIWSSKTKSRRKMRQNADRTIFDITDEIIKFEVFADLSDEFSFRELKDELEEILCVSDISSKALQSEILGPRFNEVCKKLVSEKSSTDGYIITITGSAPSSFRDFESNL